MDTWKNAFFLQEKPMSIKFLVLGGGYFGFLGGWGECRFYFYGREDFSEFLPTDRASQAKWPLKKVARCRGGVATTLLPAMPQWATKVV